jgi:hypothetical protein
MQDSQSPTFSDDDLFLRDSDRDRMALAFAALLHKRQSLLLGSDSDVMLEHYGKILVQQLRRQDEVQVEVYFPSSSEALIQRFNDVLAPMSLEDAVATSGPTLPARILVLHDARSVQTSQLELLSRLVNDFPGANVRVVLLVNTNSQLDKDIAAFGKRMSRWTVETPDAQAGELFLRKATMAGLEDPATTLLERLGLMGNNADAYDDFEDEDLDFSARDPAAEQALLQAVAQHNENDGDEEDRPRRSSLKPLLLGAVAVLLISVAAVLTLSSKYRDLTLEAAQSWTTQIKAAIGLADTQAQPGVDTPEPVSADAVIASEASTDTTPNTPPNTPSDIAPDTASENVIDTSPGAAPDTTVDTAPEQTVTPQASETPTPTGAPAPEAQTPQDMTERLARSLKVQEAATLAPAASASPEPALPAVPVVAQPVVDPVWQDARTDLQLSRTARGLASAAAGDTAPIVAALADDARFAAVALPTVVATAETALQPVPAAIIAPAPAPTPARDAPNAPTPTPAVAAPDAPTAQAKSKPAPAAAAGNAWVRSLPQGNWLIQYVSVKDQAQAQQWMAQHPQIKGLHAVDMVKRGTQERHVVVVQGPHTSQARAQAFASSAESPKEYWVRTARSVRGDMAKP